MLETFRPIGSHAVHIVIPHLHENGKVEIAVMDYTKGHGTPKAYTTLRLPTESQRNGEGLMVTALRGVREETAMDPNRFEVQVWGVAYAEFFPDQNDSESSHLKAAVVMRHVSGELRNFQKVDQDDLDELHGPMQWVEVNEILDRARRRREGKLPLIASHGAAICGFLQILARREPAIAKNYYNFLYSYRGPGLTSQKERDELERYMA